MKIFSIFILTLLIVMEAKGDLRDPHVVGGIVGTEDAEATEILEKLNKNLHKLKDERLK